MKFDPARSAKLRFSLQSKFGDFIPFDKTYAITPAGLHSVVHLQLIISARPSHDCYPPWYLNPM